jgi:O-antigen ligase
LEQNKFKTLLLYSFIVLTGTLSICNLTIDQTLTFKLFIFLFGISLITLTFSKKISINVDFINLVYFMVIVWQISSLIFAKNKEEALFGNVKNIFGFFCFILTIYFYDNYGHKLINILQNCAKIISVFTFSNLIYQIANSNKFEIYNYSGVHGHINLISSFLIIICGIILIDFKFKSINSKIITLVCLLLNITTIIILQTRAVWLGILIGITISLILNIKTIKTFLSYKINSEKKIITLTLIISSIITMLCIVPLYEYLKWCIKNQKNIYLLQDNDLERILLWNKTFHMIQKKPFLGVGTNNWQIYFPNETLNGIWRAEDLNVTFQRPHNDLLWILSENGLVALFLFITLIFGILFKIYCKTENSENLNIYIFIGISVVFITSSFFDFPKERIEHIFWWNTWLGIIYSKFKFENKRIEINKRITIIVSFSILTLCTLRLISEINHKKMLKEIQSKNSKMIIERGMNAKSIIYSIDNFSYPIDWYIGKVYTEQNDLKKALCHLNNGYNKAPFNRYLLNDLGVVYNKLNNQKKAIKFIKESIRISPRFSLPKLNLCSIYLKNGEITKAKKIEISITNESVKRDFIRKKISSFVQKK